MIFVKRLDQQRTASGNAVTWLHHLQHSDRALLMTCLAIPLVLTVVAFILAVALTAFSVPEIGTVRSTAAGWAYVYLVFGMAWIPAYLMSGAWFWWATRNAETDVLKRLYMTPLLGSLFIWFPSLTFAPASASQKLQMFPYLAFTAIFVGYIWVGLVRLMYYFWREK